jgi:Raf kinase inhibitor-like YbhB/YbcL family protein
VFKKVINDMIQKPVNPNFMAEIANKTLIIKSPAFSNKGLIPYKYSCEGANYNPELTIDELPNETKSLAIIMEDPDAPGETFVHWITWNIPPTIRIIENSSIGIKGKNSKLENNYYGPCPPTGTHDYHFMVYALDKMLDISPNSDKKALLKAIAGHIIGTGELIGIYEK